MLSGRMLSAPPALRIPRPVTRRHVHSPRDWGIGMTVCVAAICDGGTGPSSAIVTASDRLLTWGSFSTSETAMKATRIAPRWLTMIAGEDITLGVEDVIRHTRATLDVYEGEHPNILQVQAA